VEWHDGGAAGNVSAWLANCDTPVDFVGYVGDDDLGPGLVERLKAHGVGVRVERFGRTPRIVSVSHAEGRSLLVDRGGDFSQATPPALECSDALVHVPLFALYRPDLQARTETVLETARSSARCLVIDTCSAVGLQEFGVPRFLSLCERVSPSFVLANAEEAALLELDSRHPLLASSTVVVHRGSEDTVLYRPNDVSAIPVGPPLSSGIDTTGAGDAFAAGFLNALADRSDPLRAVHSAHAVARRAIALTGARPDLPAA
jgi:sugar/nucleoside kinase (ribokinase family)